MSILRIDNLEKIINTKVEFPASHSVPLKKGTMHMHCTFAYPDNTDYCFEIAIVEYRLANSGGIDYNDIFTWVLVKIDTTTVTKGMVKVTIDNGYDSRHFRKYFDPYNEQTNFIRYIDIRELTTPTVFVESVLKLFTDYHSYSHKFLDQLN